MDPDISIVICTHRRFFLVEQAVRSFCKQSLAATEFEIIVVDNDRLANDEVKQSVSSAAKSIQIKYVHDPVLGLSHARNTGLAAARAAYVGFVDDDAKASGNYLEKALQIIRERSPDYFGGPYYPYYLIQKPKWFRDEYESGIPASGSRFLRKDEFLNGTNMIFKKSLLEQLGGFDEDFGMKGKNLGYGEETALQMKAWKVNTPQVYYDNDLVVFHLVANSKLKLSDRLARRYRVGKSQAGLWKSGKEISYSKKPPISVLRVIINFLIKAFPGIFFRNRRAYPFWQNYVYEIWGAYAAGLGQELSNTKKLAEK